MAEERDIAFCFRGWAYDTGKVGRPKRRVIRISRAHTSRGAKAILATNDTTDAGFEWTHGVASKRSSERRQAMRYNINAFYFEFRGVAQEVPQQTPPSSLLDNHVDHGQAYETSTSEKVATFISTVISAYKTFPHKAYLRQVVDRFKQLEQTSLEGLSTLGEEAWPHQFEAAGEDRISVSAVLELSKALCAIPAPGITIHESLYLGVIVSFCTMFSGSHAASRDVGDNLIQSAIRIARGTTLAPVSASPLAQTGDGNPGVALLEALIRENGARVEQFKAWVETGGQTYAPGGILEQLYEMVQLANVVIGTQNQKAIVTVLGQVKPLVLASAFGTVSRIPTPVDGNTDIFGAVIQAAVHVVVADVVDKFATQADQESDAMDALPTLPGLPANLVKLADKVSDLYHALGSVKEESARNAVSEAIGDYEENQHGEEAPEPSSTLGLPSSLCRKDATFLRYMRQVFEKERDFPGSQDLDKELAWASGMDRK
ncbi:Hypothetical protein NCS54_00681000 [Fusarium falciforme]|uniref:Hypothetical protein n=1 Tax=Fusarium falciforme TaxID=195108 RepID=UPI0023013710|nr:Hypothetical protein NCS54_00681000 [Fusarium falciforme]WAO89419.1 Hypothetical protein NCS54_00681000 [Fusarium falciforme]